MCTPLYRLYSCHGDRLEAGTYTICKTKRVYFFFIDQTTFIVTHRQEYLKIRTFALENYQFGDHPAIARKVISHVMRVRSLRDRYSVNEPITMKSAATLCQSDHQ